MLDGDAQRVQKNRYLTRACTQPDWCQPMKTIIQANDQGNLNSLYSANSLAAISHLPRETVQSLGAVFGDQHLGLKFDAFRAFLGD